MTGNKSRFSDMRDDLPWEKPGAESKPRTPSQGDLPLKDEGLLEYERRRQLNLAKNRNRKYKPQKGRMKLLVCHSCNWKVRAAQSTIDRALNAPCPACIRDRVKTPGVLIQGD